MRALILILVVVCIFFAGCAILDKVAPSQLDESGEPIPGSREPTELTKSIADSVPYGSTALYFLLFAVGGYEKFKSYKLEKGLKATLLAGKQVAKDPEMKVLWEKVKEKYYRPAHESAGITGLIKILIAKLP